MKRSFDVIGAPFNHLACVTTKQNSVDGLRSGGRQSWLGLSQWIALRNQNWACDIEDCGDVAVDSAVLALLESGAKLEALNQYCCALSARLMKSYHAGRTPITIGGDHSIAVATLQATMDYYQKQRGKKVAVIWVDAHADCNNSLDSHLHGKPLAMLMNQYSHHGWSIDSALAVKPENVFYIGVRDLMPNEYQLISDLKMTNYDISHIDNLGINAVIQKLMAQLETDFDHIYLSFDYDVLDGSIFRACATPNVGGLSAREALHLVSALSSSHKFVGADFVEYLPELDHNGVSQELMVKLIDAVWGFRT
ncbi:arginase family protein [Agarivorans sp. MS3-6]